MMDTCRYRQDRSQTKRDFFTSPARNRSAIASPRPRYKFFRQAPKRVRILTLTEIDPAKRSNFNYTPKYRIEIVQSHYSHKHPISGRIETNLVR